MSCLLVSRRWPFSSSQFGLYSQSPSYLTVDIRGSGEAVRASRELRGRVRAATASGGGARQNQRSRARSGIAQGNGVHGTTLRRSRESSLPASVRSRLARQMDLLRFGP
ncbi:hypothetical protein E2C01_036949 [Portunus trituberculatus]|uniref:Uncharacterized protein n=1 Tax=Portunus trituberculatus TaxID=210409 RepID=A0A5B7FDB4_PORTR|nr:hypothetical protein [Portunus trituberculatus]